MLLAWRLYSFPKMCILKPNRLHISTSRWSCWKSTQKTISPCRRFTQGLSKKKKNHLRSSISFQLDLSKIFLKQKHIVAVSFSLIQSIREHYNQNRPSKPIDQKHLHPNEVDEGAQKDLTWCFGVKKPLIQYISFQLELCNKMHWTKSL